MSNIASLGIKGVILSPSSGEEYTKALHRNSDLSILNAKYVVFPTAFSDIPPILAYATTKSPPLEIVVKGGGCHSSTWSSSEGGIVIDLARLKQVIVSDDRQYVTVQGGAVWGDVYEACGPVGVDVVGGQVWFVGVGGYLLGGGHSFLSPERGMAVDNILAAKVVLADGRVVKTSATEEPDLFWAIRGGGNQFGIVVEFVLRGFPSAGPATIGALVYPSTEIANVLRVTQDWKKTAARDRVHLAFGRAPPHFEPRVVITPYVQGDPAHADLILAPFRNAVKPILDITFSAPDQLAVSHAADAQMIRAPRRLKIYGALVTDLWTDMVLEVWARWSKFTEENEDARGSTILFEISNTAKIVEVGATETAFHVREPHYCVAIQGRNTSPATDAATAKFASSLVQYLRQTQREKTHKDLGVIIAFTQGDEPREDIFGSNLPRLRKIKAKYDPKKLWSKGCSIEPDFD